MCKGEVVMKKVLIVIMLSLVLCSSCKVTHLDDPDPVGRFENKDGR